MCKLVSMDTNFGTKIDVADIKKKYIENIISSAAGCDKIDSIILFGSALEERCKNTSDIDIAIISTVTRSRLFASATYKEFTNRVYDLEKEQDYDILQFNSKQALEKKKDFVCQEILNKGQIIYKRQVS